MRCLNRKESLVVNLDCCLCPQNSVCSWQQLIRMNEPGIHSTYTHTSKKDDNDFLISEDIPKYTIHNLCTSWMRIRLGMMQIVMDTAMNGRNLQISMGFFHYRFPWTLQEAEWLLDGNFRANDEAHLWEVSTKMHGRQEILEENKSNYGKWKTKTTFQDMNVDGLNIPRYECGWTTSTVENLFAMCFMTFRIWSCCWKFLSRSEPKFLKPCF